MVTAPVFALSLSCLPFTGARWRFLARHFPNQGEYQIGDV